MIKVTTQAKCVLDKLTQDLNEPGDHREISNSPSFMSVHVEHVGTCDLGPMFSIAHYYEQNGDLMKYPDMVFIRDQAGEYYPFEFQQDNLGVYQCAVKFSEGKVEGVNLRMQRDMASFAGDWMKNIKHQQGL